MSPKNLCFEFLYYSSRELRYITTLVISTNRCIHIYIDFRILYFRKWMVQQLC